MAERKYTVAEIIRMREASEFIGSRSHIRMSGEVTEAQLRTYMANGTDPAELDETVSGMLSAERVVNRP